jgi:hypothetical protein
MDPPQVCRKHRIGRLPGDNSPHPSAGRLPAQVMNGDGFDDVVVGSRYYSGGQADEGRASLFLVASGLSASAAWHAEGNVADAGLG